MPSFPLKFVCTIQTTFRETPEFPSRLTDIHFGRNPHKFKGKSVSWYSTIEQISQTFNAHSDTRNKKSMPNHE